VLIAPKDEAEADFKNGFEEVGYAIATSSPFMSFTLLLFVVAPFLVAEKSTSCVLPWPINN